jgi:hypothetical protein
MSITGIIELDKEIITYLNLDDVRQLCLVSSHICKNNVKLNTITKKVIDIVKNLDFVDKTRFSSPSVGKLNTCFVISPNKIYKDFYHLLQKLDVFEIKDNTLIPPWVLNYNVDSIKLCKDDRYKDK